MNEVTVDGIRFLVTRRPDGVLQLDVWSDGASDPRDHNAQGTPAFRIVVNDSAGFLAEEGRFGRDALQQLREHQDTLDEDGDPIDADTERADAWEDLYTLGQRCGLLE